MGRPVTTNGNMCVHLFASLCVCHGHAYVPGCVHVSQELANSVIIPRPRQTDDVNLMCNWYDYDELSRRERPLRRHLNCR